MTNCQEKILKLFVSCDNKISFLKEKSKKFSFSKDKVKNIKDFVESYIFNLRQSIGFKISSLKLKQFKYENCKCFISDITKNLYVFVNDNTNGIFFVINKSGIITNTIIFENKFNIKNRRR